MVKGLLLWAIIARSEQFSQTEKCLLGHSGKQYQALIIKVHFLAVILATLLVMFWDFISAYQRMIDILVSTVDINIIYYYYLKMIRTTVIIMIINIL